MSILGLVLGGSAGIAPGLSQGAVLQEAENVSFKWGFGAMTGPAEPRRFVPITKDSVLKSGDQLKMVVALKKQCFVYVIYYSSSGEIALLFPYAGGQFPKDYKIGENYYLPKGQTWFELDKNVGKETVFLLASAQRLNELESLLGKYVANDKGSKPDLGKQVLAEIRDAKKRYRTFTTVAERPIAIGGNVRNLIREKETRRPDVASVAVEVSANNFYSKTFTLDHQ